MEMAQIILSIAGTLGGITVIVVTAAKISKSIKRFIHFLDDYFGEEARPGFEGRPGMQERLRKIENEVEHISYEMKPNSGTSIKDAINRIEKRITALEEKDNKIEN